jgi:glutathione S-transferase
MKGRKMIKLYTWGTPNGKKVSIMLEEIAMPYEVSPINIGKNDQFKPEYLAINPNNKIPSIIDTEGPGGKPFTLFESGAILMYLAEKSGKLWPADMRQRYLVIQWLMFQMGGVGPMFGQANYFYRLEESSLRHRALSQGGAAFVRRSRQGVRPARVSRRRIFDCRYRDVHLGRPPRGPSRQARRISQCEALVRYDLAAAGGAAGNANP